MSRKIISGRGVPALALAAFSAVGTALAPGLTAAADQETRTIKRDSEDARKMAEPSYQTREERLNAKPLDWNATIGKPKRKAQSAAEKKSMQQAKPGSQDGGKPDPKADDEARRLHPDDWKEPAQR